LVIFFDEFDRLNDPEVHRLFADTLKTLSDEVLQVTIVVVGVADNVNELIYEHVSIERAIMQIHMPRMSRLELAKIVRQGLKSVDMRAEAPATSHITALSQGLPHYTHLLAQQAAVSAVYNGDGKVVYIADVEEAVTSALKFAQESIRDLYYRATYSARENMYKQVLLACATAQADEKGFFPAAAVRDSLSVIMARPLDIPQFAAHLNALSSDRGPVLNKDGRVKRFRYRFLNPLMQPYIVMKGLADGLIIRPTLEILQQSNRNK
jgi:hypothetical protein